MTIGEKLRLERQKKGYSQENLANFLGITTSAYGDLERNKTELTLTRAQKIAEYLAIDVLQFIYQDSDEILKLKIEKLEFEAAYWKEKYHNSLLKDALENQKSRSKIGFKNAS